MCHEKSRSNKNEFPFQETSTTFDCRMLSPYSWSCLPKGVDEWHFLARIQTTNGIFKTCTALQHAARCECTENDEVPMGPSIISVTPLWIVFFCVFPLQPTSCCVELMSCPMLRARINHGHGQRYATAACSSNIHASSLLLPRKNSMETLQQQQQRRHRLCALSPPSSRESGRKLMRRHYARAPSPPFPKERANKKMNRRRQDKTTGFAVIHISQTLP